MPRFGSTPFSFPDFHGATRRLVLWNLIAFFVLAAAGLASAPVAGWLVAHTRFFPPDFLGGLLWQPFTYSLVHGSLWGTLFELLSLWFLAGFLENYHSASWVTGLYATSVLGTAAAATLLALVSAGLHLGLTAVALSGCFGGIFGLLVAIGVLYGDIQFMLFPLPMGIKARYLAAIYALISIAMLFGQQKAYAFSELGGALAGLVYIRMAPRRGLGFAFSEWWFGLRNGYYRWKRRRAARKFEVYMRSQGRSVRLDGQGRQLDDPEDRKKWN